MQLDRDNSSRALAQLRARLSGIVACDGRLPPERDLSARLGVGRRAVRRALDVLVAEGMIWRHQGKGTFVGRRPGPGGELAHDLVGRTNPAEVFEARAALEPELARLAAARATHDDVARMRSLCDQIGAAPDHDARELWDEALHRMIARASGNALVSGLHAVLEDVRRDEAWRELRIRARSDSIAELYNAQHIAIVDAIAARDGDAAGAAMRDHIATLEANILARTGEEIADAG